MWDNVLHFLYLAYQYMKPGKSKNELGTLRTFETRLNFVVFFRPWFNAHSLKKSFYFPIKNFNYFITSGFYKSPTNTKSNNNGRKKVCCFVWTYRMFYPRISCKSMAEVAQTIGMLTQFHMNKLFSVCFYNPDKKCL